MDRETEHSLTTDEQYVKEQLADPFCTEYITNDAENGQKTDDGKNNS